MNKPYSSHIRYHLASLLIIVLLIYFVVELQPIMYLIIYIDAYGLFLLGEGIVVYYKEYEDNLLMFEYKCMFVGYLFMILGFLISLNK